MKYKIRNEVISDKEINQARKHLHGNANGKIIGQITLSRADHVRLKAYIGWPVFIGTRSLSGAIIVRRRDIVLGTANCNQAGRGYVFASIKNLQKAVEQ